MINLQNISTQQKEIIENFLKKNDLDILYLSHFGSKLYGTDTINSDSDFKGIFLPRKTELLLGKAPKVFSYSTGNDNEKNTSEDFDFELYSLHNFLNMVERGDTGALDLLFSYTNQETIIFSDQRWKKFINNKSYLFNPQNTRAFLGYAIGQASKYGLRGTRLNLILKLREYLDSLTIQSEEVRLSNYIDEIIEKFSDKSYLREEQSGPHRAIRLLGTVHQEVITMHQFSDRIDSIISKYGKRSYSAMNQNGIDYKAISHAIRVTLQAKQLLKTGNIKFPLERARLILDIKLGNMSFDEISELLSNEIEEVDKILKQKNHVENQFNRNIVEQLILELYS